MKNIKYLLKNIQEVFLDLKRKNWEIKQKKLAKIKGDKKIYKGKNNNSNNLSPEITEQIFESEKKISGNNNNTQNYNIKSPKNKSNVKLFKYSNFNTSSDNSNSFMLKKGKNISYNDISSSFIPLSEQNEKFREESFRINKKTNTLVVCRKNISSGHNSFIKNNSDRQSFKKNATTKGSDNRPIKSKIGDTNINLSCIDNKLENSKTNLSSIVSPKYYKKNKLDAQILRLKLKNIKKMKKKAQNGEELILNKIKEHKKAFQYNLFHKENYQKIKLNYKDYTETHTKILNINEKIIESNKKHSYSHHTGNEEECPVCQNLTMRLKMNNSPKGFILLKNLINQRPIIEYNGAILKINRKDDKKDFNVKNRSPNLIIKNAPKLIITRNKNSKLKSRNNSEKSVTQNKNNLRIQCKKINKNNRHDRIYFPAIINYFKN